LPPGAGQPDGPRSPITPGDPSRGDAAQDTGRPPWAGAPGGRTSASGSPSCAPPGAGGPGGAGQAFSTMAGMASQAGSLGPPPLGALARGQAQVPAARAGLLPGSAPSA